MTFVHVVLSSVVAIEAAAIVALVHRGRRLARCERELRESEERFRLLADRAPVIIWTARPDTKLDYVNTTCVEFTGLPLGKLLDEGWLEVVHPDDLDRSIGVYVPAFEARVPFLFEYRARRADGAYRWLLASGVPKFGPDGGFTGYIGCDIDITELKTAEDRIRDSRAALASSHREIQHLAGRLIEAQDAERARLARDLHDDVSQQLAGLSIALSGLRHRLDAMRAGDELQEDLRQLHERTATLAQNVRHLSHDLHPTVLRHAGLVAALDSYCEELERVHRMNLRCSTEGDCASIGPEAALCLYRIAQEGLRNVVAHARARSVHVHLECTAEDAQITITDDGVGFDVDDVLRRGQGLGLVSIQERARLARGTTTLTSEPEKGTQMRVRIPVRAPARSSAGPEAGDGRSEYTRA